MDEVPKKPVRELLQDISKNVEPSREIPRGLVNPTLMRRITIITLILCLLLIAATFIGMIWTVIGETFGLRFVATVGVFAGTLLIFQAINAQFE